MLERESITPHQKLVEVPVKIVIPSASESKSCWHILFQEMEKLAALWPVHVYLAEHWECYSILVLGKLLDVLIGASLLLTKLITWECQYLEHR